MSAEQRTIYLKKHADTGSAREGGWVRLYRHVSQVLSERWFGGVHAGLVVKSLYLQRALGRSLRSGQKRVLDAGCGPEGQLATLLAARYPTCSVEGIDLYCASSGSRANVMLKEADLGTLTAVSTYDLVYSIDVLEHIHDYAGVLDRLVSALRPGGLLFIHVPSAEQQSWFKATDAEAANNFRENRPGDDHVREGFEKAALVADLERRSISIVEARWTFNGLTSWVKEVYSLGERRGVRGVGLMLLPAVVLSVMVEMLMAPRRGNGLCVLGMKKGSGAL